MPKMKGWSHEGSPLIGRKRESAADYLPSRAEEVPTSETLVDYRASRVTLGDINLEKFQSLILEFELRSRR